MRTRRGYGTSSSGGSPPPGALQPLRSSHKGDGRRRTRSHGLRPPGPRGMSVLGKTVAAVRKLTEEEAEKHGSHTAVLVFEDGEAAAMGPARQPH